MEMLLLSAVSCSRIDVKPYCRDGRGGIVLSQCDSSWSYKSFKKECGVTLSLSIFASTTVEDDEIERSELIAEMNGRVIGTNVFQFNSYSGQVVDDGAIFKWHQCIELTPRSNGLVSVTINAKLKSQSTPQEVTGRSYCYVTEEDRDHIQLSPLKYFIKNLKNRKTFN
jgi:hypothetical protein